MNIKDMSKLGFKRKRLSIHQGEGKGNKRIDIWMKRISILVYLFLLLGCVNKGIYTDEEYSQLKDYGVVKEAIDECQYPKTVQIMLHDDFNQAYVKNYCEMELDSSVGVNVFIEAGLSEEEIKEYQSYSYMREENISRYLVYQASSIQEKILKVNMNLDLEAYENSKVIDQIDDYAMVVNKYNTLPEGYIPNDLVEVGPNCIFGKDYSCSNNKKLLRKEAAKAWNEFVEAASEQNIHLRIIAAFRSYEYQKGLYDYYYKINGKEYADKYFARPGQSEHNAGLAIDITFNDYIYTEIEEKEGYDWIIHHMHEYGFILRYPKDKTNITLYGYESWHLRYVGKELAKKIYDENLTLEEYYAMQ